MASSITIENVHAAYGSVRVIEDVSIKLEPGSMLALVGDNGAGKTTLVKCIAGVHRPEMLHQRTEHGAPAGAVGPEDRTVDIEQHEPARSRGLGGALEGWR